MKVKKVAKNATWIVGCKIVQSVVALFISMMTARYLGPSNYGLINYAASIVAFFVPIMTLGINNILVQEYVNSPEKEGEVLGTSMLMCLASAVACMIGVISFAFITAKNDFEVVAVSALYSVSLITQALEMIRYWYQARYLAKYSSLISFAAYVLVALYQVYLLITGKSVLWFSISVAMDYFLIALLLLILYFRLGGKRLSLSKETGKRMFSKSRYYIVSSMMVAIFAQTDKVMIKLMLGSEYTGYYSAAVACAGVLNFVFVAIIDSFRPSVFEEKQIGQKEYESVMTGLYSIIIYFSLLQSLFMTIFAPLIINIMYGAEYSASIPVMRLIVWYTTFSYLGGVRNIWLLAENKQKYLWIINLSGALANVVLNFVLIPVMGTMGAALASLITQIFTNVIIGYIIRPISRNNTLMMRGLNPKPIFKYGKIILQRKKTED